MNPTPAVSVSAAVEGVVDEAVIRKLIQETGASVGAVYGRKGKPHLRQRISAYNQAARRNPWVVLVDLDRDPDCAPVLRTAWIPIPARLMCFRVAVREVEAWLLADSEGLARFLGIPQARIPTDPESLVSPKETMIGLARLSRRNEIRDDIVPCPRSGRQIGPAYTSRMTEFVNRLWRPEVAQRSSESLRRCRLRIQEMIHLMVQK